MPLEAQACTQRRQRLIEQVNADQIVISNPQHILYFSGYWVTPLHIGSWGSPHLLIDSRTGHSTLLTHNFAPDTHTAFVDEVRTWPYYSAGPDPAPPLFPSIVAALRPHVGKHIAAELGCLPYGLGDIDVDDITLLILSMRRRKDDDELAMIRTCIRAIEAGHRAAREHIRPDVSEIEVYNAIVSAMVEEAGEPILPIGDFVSGERASNVAGGPSRRSLQPGDLMIVDLFPVIGGYRADFTATCAVSDSLTEAQQRLEEALHTALAAGEALLRPGAAAREVYNAVKETLDRQGYAGAFPHHAGHGLGLDHPEAPFIVANSDETLQAGDVITLEPGAYGPDFGARIEHNYRITEDGFERLTDHDTRFLG
jgi:Xaa-Pro aminopeptidase